MSPKRIVLMEPSGEVLFEGLSCLSEPPPVAELAPPEEIPVDVDVETADDIVEPCPPTMRSAESSGFFSTRERRDRIGTAA
jgi:hypothetical protein